MTITSQSTNPATDARALPADPLAQVGIMVNRPMGAALPWPDIRAQPGAVGQLLLPPVMAQAGARRLLVLVPDADIDEATWAASLWNLATPRSLPVLLVSATNRPEEQYRARRRLISLAAMTRADNVPVSVELLLDTGWEQAARRFWKPGDLLVCPSELRAGGLFGHRALAQALVRRLGAPVYVLTGYCPALPDERLSLTRRMLAWVPPVLILIAFFWVQTQLTKATAGPLQTTALIGTVIVEFVLIALWEHLINNL